eukprot:14399455-Heterocapsa_arctica.AAC.1
MNRLRGLQAALIGFPYNYPAEPMTGVMRSCPPGPGLGLPWTELFPVPILMMDIPSYYRGISNAKKKVTFRYRTTLMYARSFGNSKQDLLPWDAWGPGTQKKEKFGSLRIITSYRKYVDQLV